MHGGKSIFKQAAGLHEPITGMAVVAPAGGDDPEVIFEEHGTDTVCQYFELLSNDQLLDEKLGPTTAQPKIRARCGDSDVRVAWQAMQAAFLLEQPAFVNKMLRACLKMKGLRAVRRNRCAWQLNAGIQAI